MSEVNLNEVSILVDGQIYKGWKSARIECSIEQISRAFALSVTDNFPGNENFKRLGPGQKVQLFIGSDVVCTGYITSTPIRYDAKSVTVQVQGKSKTVDLVDCCSPWAAIAPNGGGVGQKPDSWQDVKGVKQNTKSVPAAKTVNKSWHNQSAKQIISDLCAPSGINVICEVEELNSKLANFTVNPGEKVFESINRLLTKENLIVTDNELGDLVIAEVASAEKCDDMLETGKNVISGSAGFDFSKRYSKYVVLGQHKGTDLEFGSKVSQDQGIAEDPGVNRPRLLVLKDTGQSSNTLASNRAEFEKNLNAAKSNACAHRVQGWRQTPGHLWKINSEIEINDQILKLRDVQLITKITYSLDNSGSFTDIESMPKDGYSKKGSTNNNTSKNTQSSSKDSWKDVK